MSSVASRLKIFCAVAGLLLLLVVAQVRQGWVFDSDVLALLPDAATNPLQQQIAGELADQGGRSIVLLIRATQAEHGHKATLAIAQLLESDAAFESLSYQVDPDALGARARSLLPFKRGLLSPQHREWLEAGKTEPLRQEVLRALFTPSGLGRMLPFEDDPLGLLSRFVQQSLPPAGPLSSCEGLMCVQQDKTNWYLIRAQMSGSPFQLSDQTAASKALSTAISSAINRWPDVQILRSGVLLHAHAAREQASAELSSFGLISMFAVLAVLYACFRTLRPAALSVACITFGLSCGLMVCQLLFGRVHLATLVFGTSLIGLAVDYVLHFFCDQFRQPQSWSGQVALAAVGPALRLSLATTVLAYCALLVLPIPALRQMAVFSIAGLLGSGAFVLCVFPALARQRAGGRQAGLHRVAGSISRFMEQQSATRRYATLAFLGLFAVGGLWQISFQDGVRQLQSSPKELVQAEHQMTALLGPAPDRRFIHLTAANAEMLLRAEESLSARLDPLIADEKLGSYLAISRFVPSVQRQKQNLELWRQHIDGPNGLRQLIGTELGFDLPETAPTQAQWLTPAAVLDQPAGQPLKALWLGQRAGRYHSLVLLTGMASEAAVAQAARQSDASLVDQLSDISAALSQLRVQGSRLLLVMSLVMAAALAWRYGLSSAVQSMLPACGGSLLALALLSWLGVPLSLFNILALLLLLGMGVDYAIFLRESRESDQASILATGLSALTTVLAFGLLSFSQTPYVQDIGQTVAPGIVFVFLLAVLLKPGQSGPHAATDAQRNS